MISFNEFYNLLFEKNFNYSLPKDPELQLYDFYLMAYIANAVDMNAVGDYMVGGRAVAGDRARTGVDDTTKYSFELAKDEILDSVSQKMCDAVYYAVTSEFRYVTDKYTFQSENDWEEPESDPDVPLKRKKSKGARALALADLVELDERENELFLHWYKAFYGRKSEQNLGRSHPRLKTGQGNEDRLRSYNAWDETDAEQWEVISIAEKFFADEAWVDGYGGESWATICDAWLKLYFSKGDKRITWIDRLYDMQHNTGTVLNKVEDYYKADTEWDWILHALDTKANLKHVSEFLTLASPQMSKMGRMLLAQSGFKTQQDKLPEREAGWALKTLSEIYNTFQGDQFSDVYDTDGVEPLHLGGKRGARVDGTVLGNPDIMCSILLYDADDEYADPVVEGHIWDRSENKRSSSIVIKSGLLLTDDGNGTLIAWGTLTKSDPGGKYKYYHNKAPGTEENINTIFDTFCDIGERLRY